MGNTTLVMQTSNDGAKRLNMMTLPVTHNVQAEKLINIPIHKRSLHHDQKIALTAVSEGFIVGVCSEDLNIKMR